MSSRFEFYHCHRAVMRAYFAVVLAVLLTSTAARADVLQGYGTIEGGVAIGVPDEGTAIAPGARFAAGIGAAALPVTVGIAYAVYSSGSLKLRQLELVLKVQPHWDDFRPFARASVGYTTVNIAGFDYDYERTTSDDWGVHYALALGVDLEPWALRRDDGKRETTHGWLTLGLQGFVIGQLQGYNREVSSGHLLVITPFVGLTLQS